MTPADSPLHPEGGESLYQFLTEWASHALPRRLALLAMGGIGTATIVMLLGASWWPLAALLAISGMVGAWGLVHHRWEAHHSALLRGVEWFLVALGSLLLLLAGLGVMVLLLGQPWKL